MAAIRIYLDDRRRNSSDTFSLKLSVSHKGKTAYIPLDIMLRADEWQDDKQKVKKHPLRDRYNDYIRDRITTARDCILEISKEGKLRTMTAIDIRDYIKDAFNPTAKGTPLVKYAEEVRDSYKTQSTKALYTQMIQYLKGWNKDICIEELTKKDIQSFFDFMRESIAQNTACVYMSKLRCIINKAIDDEIIENAPFQRLTFRMVETRKRSLDIDRLVKLYNYSPDNNKQKIAKDTFFLIFFLIGINISDLIKVTKVDGGRIDYYRNKTNKFYSIRVEPEALSIINRYRNDSYILPQAHIYNHANAYDEFVNRHLVNIGKDLDICDRLTTYYARHTWATLALSIGIPKDVISMALGHSFGARITDTYLDYGYSYQLIDDANRKVIDYLKSRAELNAAAPE